MRAIAGRNIAAYDEAHPTAAAALRQWLAEALAANWGDMNSVQQRYPKRSVVLNGDRVRFAIAGGAYRLIVAFNFRRQIAFVKFIGTHAEYDKVDALTVEQF